jgi:catalase
MVWHLFMVEDELGQRVGDGLGISADDVRGLPPLQSQTLTDEEARAAAQPRQQRPRDVSGLTMTHCVPNEHVAVAEAGELATA